MSEYHLFLFWQWPEDKTGEVVARLSERFAVRRVCRLAWSEEKFDENIRRFYAMLPEQAAIKRTEMGHVPFLLVVVEDMNLQYRLRISGGSGFLSVNSNTFDLKQDFRREGIAVHVTNDPSEFRRDILLLTGVRASEIEKTFAISEQPYPEVRADILGANGWTSLEEIFSVLNEAVPYVVLRNFEQLPYEHLLGAHDDIDLLLLSIDANDRAAAILNDRGAATVKVGSREIYFDLRAVEHLYYDPCWSRKILRDRVLQRGLYVASPQNYFWSLFYHGHVHKPSMSRDYIPRLVALAREIELQGITEDALTDPAQAAQLIGGFLKGQGYFMTRPHGCPAFNMALASSIHEVQTVYHDSIGLLDRIAAAQTAAAAMTISATAGATAVSIPHHLLALEENSRSRWWLARALAQRLLAYPGDIARRIRAR